MKTINCKLTVLVIACFLATALNGQFSGVPNSYMHARLFTCEHPENIQLLLVNMMNLHTTISLLNENGDILYTKEVDDLAAWSEKLRLRSFEDGDYFIVAKQSGVEKNYNFRVKDKKVFVAEESAIVADVTDRKAVLVSARKQ